MLEFITILRQRFLSPMHERQARVALWSIGQRQGESVHAFSCRFQNLLQRLTTYDATDILERYIRALRPELRLAVAQKDPKTLQEAVYFSEHLELLTASYGVRSSSGSTSQSASYQQQGHQGQPSRQRKQRKRGGGSGGQQQPQQQQRPVQAQAQGQQRSGQQQGQRKQYPPCPHCNKYGHHPDRCWVKYGRPQQQGGQPAGQQGQRPAGRNQARSAALAPVAAESAPQQQGPQQHQHHPQQGNAPGPQ